jgi:hypothetical protein
MAIVTFKPSRLQRTGLKSENCTTECRSRKCLYLVEQWNFDKCKFTHLRKIFENRSRISKFSCTTYLLFLIKCAHTTVQHSVLLNDVFTYMSHYCTAREPLYTGRINIQCTAPVQCGPPTSRVPLSENLGFLTPSSIYFLIYWCTVFHTPWSALYHSCCREVGYIWFGTRGLLYASCIYR